MMAHILRATRTLLGRFARDTGGAIAIVWGLAAIVVVGVVGAGIDYSRAVNAKTVLAQQLDSAVLAGARYLTNSADISEAKTYIVAVFTEAAKRALGDTASYKITTDDIAISETDGTITATVNAGIKTAFMRIMGVEEMPVSINSRANFSDKYLEIALVLDVTGSMDDPATISDDDGHWGWHDDDVSASQSRLEALKDASTELINQLIPSEEDNDRVRIAVIPYSEGVRLTSAQARKATDDYSTKCATERTGDEAYTDASYEVEPIGNGSSLYAHRFEYERDALPWDYSQSAGACPDDEILPLTASKTKLLAKINSLRAVGGTAGQTGIAWGWYTLSENWTSLWPTGSEAAANSDDETVKYMIIMTDGQFNASFDRAYIGYKECTRYRYNGSCQDWIMKTTENQYWHETYDESSPESSNRAKSLCAAMKSSGANQGHGVTIYSVYFNPKSNASAEDVMKSCASSSDNFKKAQSAQKLTETFVKFAQEIQQLYLSR